MLTTHIRSILDVHNDDYTSDEDLSDDALVEAYKIMYLKWDDECKSDEKQKEKCEILLQDKARLMATISKLKEDIDHLNSKHEGMTKSTLNSISIKLSLVALILYVT